MIKNKKGGCMKKRVIELCILLVGGITSIPIQGYTEKGASNLNYYVSYVIGPVARSRDMTPMSPLQWEKLAEHVMDYIEGTTDTLPRIPPHVALGLGYTYRLSAVKTGNPHPRDAFYAARAKRRAIKEHLHHITPHSEKEKQYIENTEKMLNFYFLTYVDYVQVYWERIVHQEKRQYKTWTSQREGMKPKATEQKENA